MSASGPANRSLTTLAKLAKRVANELEAVACLSDLRLVSTSNPPREGGELAAIARSCLHARRAREKLFPEGLFADPAWDILLDLFACDLDGIPVYVSDACLASGVPPTTGLRWLAKLEELQLVERRQDSSDGRRAHIVLRPSARQAIARWLGATFDPNSSSGRTPGP